MGEGYDYHFWRKDTNNGYWYHKFGTIRAIMRLKDKKSPTEIDEINDEPYDASAEYASSPEVYLPNGDQKVIYIVYTANTRVNSVVRLP